MNSECFVKLLDVLDAEAAGKLTADEIAKLDQFRLRGRQEQYGLTREEIAFVDEVLERIN